MRRGDKIQIINHNRNDWLRYGVFIKNKRGKKALIRIDGKEIEILRSSITLA